MRPLLIPLVLLVACGGSDKDDTDLDADTDTDADSDSDTDTDTDTDTDADTDTDTGPPPVECPDGDPVGVTVHDTRLGYVLDAVVTGTTDAGVVPCTREPDVADVWSCDLDEAGDATISVAHPLYGTETVDLPATAGCRPGGETVDVTLVPTGTHFPADRVYFNQLFADPDECENSWELYGVNCYQTAAFCESGYSAIVVTDILNLGVYDQVGNAIVNVVTGPGDIASPTVFDIVSDTEIEGLGASWVLDEAGLFPPIDCELP